LLLLGFTGAAHGASVLSPNLQPGATVTSPPIFLLSGTAGSSTIYANNTSAKVNAVAPAPTPTYYPSDCSGQNWWDSHYLYRRKMTIVNNNAVNSISAKFTVNFTINTQQMVSAGKLQAGGDDFRTVWWNSSSSSWLELDRLNTTNFNTASTTIKFRTQTSIAAGSSDSNYYIYYGYTGASNPPTNGGNVYLFEDLFNRADSSTVGVGWIEYDGIAGSNARILSDKLNLLSANGVYDTQAYHTLSGFSNRSVWEFQWDFSRTGVETTYSMWMQLGKYSSMSNTSNTAGASIYLDWTGTTAARGPAASAHQMLRVWNGGSVTEIQVLSGSHLIKFDMDLTAGSFAVYIDGSNKGTYAVYQKLSSYDCIRFVFEQVTPANFGSYNIDNTRAYLTVDTDPSVNVNQEQYFFGSYVSGTIPTSVQTVDSNYFVVKSAGSATSTTAYNPSSYNLIGSTTLISGTTADLPSNNGGYMIFRSYASATSGQTLYTHQDTTAIGGTNYYLQKLAVADAGTTLSTSMNSTTRKLFGKSVYQLAGVSTIPASTWTMYYRAWKDADPSISYDAQSSMTQSTTATSISWNHTTGAGNNRLLLVAVGVHVASGAPTTVLNVTYGGVLLTQVTTALYSADTPQVRTYAFRLVSPASGTKSIKVTFAAATLAVAGAVTYAGVDQATPIQASNTATGNTGGGGTASVSVTVTGSGRWLFGHFGGADDKAWSVASEGTGQINRWAQEGQLYKGRGSDKPVSSGSQSMSWTMQSGKDSNYVASALVINPATPAVGHIDVDILVRQSNGTVRATIATNVANSADVTSTASTLSGAYSWAIYNVVSQTDYLEIDYYVEVTTTLTGMSAYLRIDDSANPTRTTNVYLPSEFTSEVEFTGSSNTQNWYQLIWNTDSAWNTSSVSVTIQVYNYTSGGYPTLGNGYNSYTSSGTANTDETKTQTIATNPTHFRNATGDWKIKIKGVKTTTTQFDFKADWVEFKPSHYSEYSVSTEFMFSSMTNNTPTQLNFTVVSEYDIASVSVTIQVWNYSSSAYVTSGQGYQTYSSGGSNETKILSITTTPQFYASSGNAKIKITGVLSTTTQYQQKTNQIKLVYSYSSSSNYNYVLKIVNQVSDSWKIRLRAYSQSNIARLNNCTISFHNATDGTSGQIYIISGGYTQQTGPWYDLPSSPAESYIALTLEASSSETSSVYVYLDVLVPDKTTYVQYVLAFEIT